MSNPTPKTAYNIVFDVSATEAWQRLQRTNINRASKFGVVPLSKGQLKNILDIARDIRTNTKNSDPYKLIGLQCSAPNRPQGTLSFSFLYKAQKTETPKAKATVTSINQTPDATAPAASTRKPQTAAAGLNR
ncbi:MAG: hypothetical protein KDI46_02435 [Alphaproteobacteria bacterium]|nr:hypothetical protein [Alphaproteobacteria bacterium]